MSTVSGWQLHVYCDFDECDAWDEFGGATLKEAIADARACGWVISNRPTTASMGGRHARCKKHKGRREFTPAAPPPERAP